MKKISLTIRGMHCNSCSTLIEGELEDIGVNKVSVSYSNEKAEIEFDEKKLSEKKIIDKIKKLGYDIK